MRIAKGPRPWTVWTFCVISASLAAFRSTLYYANLDEVQGMFEELAPWVSWNQDWVIVATSAWLTIDLIPVMLIWFFASRFARWFILSMAVLQTLWAIASGTIQSGDLLSFLLSLGGIAVPIGLAVLLFLPASKDWFEIGDSHEAAIFE